MQQLDGPITYQQKKNMITTCRRPPTIPHDDYHLLDRAEQVTIFRLRTGHNRLRAHMFSKFKIGDSALCICGQAPQTAEHILQECWQYNTLRSKHWPGGVTLDKKLYGSVQELQKTVHYIDESSLQI